MIVSGKDTSMINRLKMDSITGFYSRTYYELKLLELFEKKKLEKVFVMFADFNFLKYANDMYGYDKVDIALKKISKILLQEARKVFKEYYIIRYGGDELLIIGFDSSFNKVCDFKKNTQTLIKELPGEESLNLSLAIGFSYCENVEKTFSKMVKEAKEKMGTDKEYIKSGSAVDVSKAVDLIIPTISRMVGKKDYKEFIRLLQKELLDEV